MKVVRIRQLFCIFLFFIPLNLYIIGKTMGFGIQWSLFLYQESVSNNVISIFQNINYIIGGYYTGITALSIWLWMFGAILMIIALIFSLTLKPDILTNAKITGIIIICSGIFFLLSIMVQYGPYFHGPAGTAIPIGLPVLFVIGGWMLMEGQKGEEAGVHEGQQNTEGEWK
jgi:hypothetical protein